MGQIIKSLASVSVSVVTPIRPQFLFDFHEILHSGWELEN